MPVSTMTEAVVDGLRSVGAKRVAVATAYADLVNDRSPISSGAPVSKSAGGARLRHRSSSAVPEKMTEQDIIDLSGKVSVTPKPPMRC